MIFGTVFAIVMLWEWGAKRQAAQIPIRPTAGEGQLPPPPAAPSTTPVPYNTIAGSVLDLIEAAPAVARLGRCCLSSPRYTSQRQCPASKKINLDKVMAIERLQLLRSALRRPVKSVCRSACVGLPRYSQASQETLSPLRDRTAFPTISRFLLAHIDVSVPHGRVGQK